MQNVLLKTWKNKANYFYSKNKNSSKNSYRHVDCISHCHDEKKVEKLLAQIIRKHFFFTISCTHKLPLGTWNAISKTLDKLFLSNFWKLILKVQKKLKTIFVPQKVSSENSSEYVECNLINLLKTFGQNPIVFNQSLNKASKKSMF